MFGVAVRWCQIDHLEALFIFTSVFFSHVENTISSTHGCIWHKCLQLLIELCVSIYLYLFLFFLPFFILLQFGVSHCENRSTFVFARRIRMKLSHMRFGACAAHGIRVYEYKLHQLVIYS